VSGVRRRGRRLRPLSRSRRPPPGPRLLRRPRPRGGSRGERSGAGARARRLRQLGDVQDVRRPHGAAGAGPRRGRLAAVPAVLGTGI